MWCSCCCIIFPASYGTSWKFCCCCFTVAFCRRELSSCLLITGGNGAYCTSQLGRWVAAYSWQVELFDCIMRQASENRVSLTLVHVFVVHCALLVPYLSPYSCWRLTVMTVADMLNWNKTVSWIVTGIWFSLRRHLISFAITQIICYTSGSAVWIVRVELRQRVDQLKASNDSLSADVALLHQSTQQHVSVVHWFFCI